VDCLDRTASIYRPFSGGDTHNPVSVTRSGECNAITNRRCNESALLPLGALAFPPASLGSELFRITLIPGDVLIRIGVNFNSFLYPK
jgi:hypothetical protein